MTSAALTSPTAPPSAARAEHMLRRGRQRRGTGGEALRLTLSGLQRNPVIICQRRGLPPPPHSHPTPPLPPPNCPRQHCSTVEVVITKRFVELPPCRARKRTSVQTFLLSIWGSTRSPRSPSVPGGSADNQDVGVSLVPVRYTLLVIQALGSQGEREPRSLVHGVLQL